MKTRKQRRNRRNRTRRFARQNHRRRLFSRLSFEPLEDRRLLTLAHPMNLSSLDGDNGFVINGIDAFDRSGTSVSNAGDVNGDGFDDVIIGAIGADPNGNSAAGESYVVFGGANVGSSASLDLANLNGSDGFVINGIDVDDLSGYSVSGAGDVNNDGFDDLIIGAIQLAGPNSGAGESYVVFGGATVGSSGALDLSSLNGSNGFVINGIDTSDFSGFSVSGAGDVNNDGFADVIIGAQNASPPGGNGGAGESYPKFVSSCRSGEILDFF